MHTLQRTTRYVVGSSVFGVAMVMAAAISCSGDNSSPEASGGGDDAAADQSTPQGDASSPQADVTTAETSTGGDDAAEDMSTTPVSDATGDVAAEDATAPVDAGSTDTGASDANNLDATSSNDGADASTPDASTTDASEAGGVCTTTLASLGSSGTNDAAAPKIIDDFDGQADAGPGSGWNGYFNMGSSGTLSVTDADGHTCDGALDLAVTAYTQYGTNVQAYFNYGSNTQDWTGYKKLHAWLKVISSNYATIQGVEPRIDSSNYADKLFGGFVSGSTFADGGWHETVVPLTAGGSYVPSGVNGYQFELQVVGTQPGGAPATPPTATLLVDSIWIE